MTARVRIGDRWVGDGEPCFVIAEAGANHNRDLAMGRALIDVAAEAGADAVKFQTYSAETLYSKKTPRFSYLEGVSDKETWDLIKEIELPRQWQGDLAAHAARRSIRFLSSPFDAQAIDELAALDVPAYKKHLRWLADAKGVTAIVANGHAAEVSSLSRDERRRALALALEEVADKVPIIAGIYSDGTREAIELARDAKAAGASGLLVFPPTIFMWGAQVKPDMVLRHFSMLADGVELPLIVFEYPPASGIGYSPETLTELCKIPTVVGVKDWSNDIVAYERNLRALRASGRPVAMLSSFTMSLMATFLLGADGCISGMGSVARTPAFVRTKRSPRERLSTASGPRPANRASP